MARQVLRRSVARVREHDSAGSPARRFPVRSLSTTLERSEAIEHRELELKRRIVRVCRPPDVRAGEAENRARCLGRVGRLTDMLEKRRCRLTLKTPAGIQ